MARSGERETGEVWLILTPNITNSRKQKEEASLSDAELQAKIDAIRKDRASAISLIKRDTQRMMDELVAKKEEALEREKVESKYVHVFYYRIKVSTRSNEPLPPAVARRSKISALQERNVNLASKFSSLNAQVATAEALARKAVERRELVLKHFGQLKTALTLSQAKDQARIERYEQQNNDFKSELQRVAKMPKLEIEKIMQQINAVAEAEEEEICKLLKTLTACCTDALESLTNVKSQGKRGSTKKKMPVNRNLP